LAELRVTWIQILHNVSGRAMRSHKLTRRVMWWLTWCTKSLIHTR
jgi:hypothetical protein